ncbi:hypothetical protein ATANTOWER_029416 [Ataeniobius toweri]|uniref:Secreted protein n=1 Tax=Ataeniobius toweri TaxID=208326 RepID=A0ABU7B9F5_9TELE|nr:hypothetical protein [Ataeniobius toweri]
MIYLSCLISLSFLDQLVRLAVRTLCLACPPSVNTQPLEDPGHTALQPVNLRTRGQPPTAQTKHHLFQSAAPVKTILLPDPGIKTLSK